MYNVRETVYRALMAITNTGFTIQYRHKAAPDLPSAEVSYNGPKLGAYRCTVTAGKRRWVGMGWSKKEAAFKACAVFRWQMFSRWDWFVAVLRVPALIVVGAPWVVLVFCLTLAGELSEWLLRQTSRLGSRMVGASLWVIILGIIAWRWAG